MGKIETLLSHFAVDQPFDFEEAYPLVWRRQAKKLSLFGSVPATGEKAFLLIHQRPFKMSRDLTKSDQEMRSVRSLLDRFLRLDSTDWSIRPGPHPNSPPDVELIIGGATLGVEVTQVHMPRAAGGAASNTAIARYQMFEKLRGQLIARASELSPQLKHLRGFSLQLSFEEPIAPAAVRLPDRRTNRIVELLKAARPRFPLGFSPTGMKAVNDYWDEAEKLGLVFSESKLDSQSEMVRKFGFDLELSYTQMVTASQAKEELQHIVRQHDHRDSQVLIVEVNTPLRSGIYFPSGHDMARMLFDAGIGDPLNGWTPANLRQILLHDVLNPEPRWRWLWGSEQGPLRGQGYVAQSIGSAIR